jgi:alpha-L-fucosidase
MKFSFARTCLEGILFAACVAARVFAASPMPLAPIPVQESALAQWRNDRFGMFIHWGPISQKGVEISWSRGKNVPVEEYDALYRTFDPEKFNAEGWVSVARAAGMKYIVLTTKHHDGFCLWDTKQTDYNIMHTPFKRDVTRELAEACKKQGIAFGVYYSTCDWHHPDFPVTSPGGKTIRETSNLDRYTDYLKAQISELLKNYGPLCTLWFDVPQRFDRDRGQSVINLARSIQPDVLVNNRTGAPGDYDTPEQRIGGFNMDRPWETCMTICQQWAWKPNDTMKSLEECLRTLICTVGGDGNLLFNVGPEPTGEIEPRQIERLREMGAWLSKYGETIYGTRGGPYEPTRRYAATRRGNVIYLHLLKWTGDTFELPPLGAEIVESSLLTGGRVEVQNHADKLTVKVAPADQPPIDTIVKLVIKGDSMAVPPIKPVVNLTASASNVFGKSPKYAAEFAFDEDTSSRWATDVGTTKAWLQVDFASPRTVDGVRIEEATAPRVKRFALEFNENGQWKTILTGESLGGTVGAFEKSFPAITARSFRLNILEAADGPSIAEIHFKDAKP